MVHGHALRAIRSCSVTATRAAAGAARLTQRAHVQSTLAQRHNVIRHVRAFTSSSGSKSSPIETASIDPTAASQDVFTALDAFAPRHIGPDQSEVNQMLEAVGAKSMTDFIQQTIPETILTKKGSLDVEKGLSESEIAARLRQIAKSNKVYKNYIGMGYAGTIVPPVILRNVLENPLMYTAYTPYQPEIAQGRLESLLNFQTMVTDLTGMGIANASLLDEATAAGEAMIMSFVSANRKKKTFFVDEQVHPQTISVLQSRAEGFGVNVVVGNAQELDFEKYKEDLNGVLLQYPATNGGLYDWSELSEKVHALKAQVVVATDLLALTLLKPPGEWGADIVLGNSQRFGVPYGFGGPHAAFFACSDAHKRKMPGRLIGVSKDSQGNKAYRLALQTREQHIRREKATSNICTSQALLANMAAMYAVYHGPEGLKRIATKVHNLTAMLAESLTSSGYALVNDTYFDTLTIKTKGDARAVLEKAASHGINLRPYNDEAVSVTLDETVTKEDFTELLSIFDAKSASTESLADAKSVPERFARKSSFLQHAVFNSHHSETEMLRYIQHLASKDLSLAHSMIPLGSCTMKLNATSEMVPLSWPEFADIHPFAPSDQTEGYRQLIKELEEDLATITGFEAVSLQPNSGAQGEYTGLRVIRAYHKANGDEKRDICLIPVSAHGTNPASAVMAGMKVVTLKTDSKGNLDLEDLKAKAEEHRENLGALMITYPSTFGVFEPDVKDACKIIHDNGGQVYMDGANMNAQIGLCSPGEIGADVCHLNLHKTFAIPHGGGGPGVGPIGVAGHLAPFLPGHDLIPGVNKYDEGQAIKAVTGAPWGSASILPISWAYVKMMGGAGLTQATQAALLNANYMRQRLSDHYKILYTNNQDRCAHEFIIDVRGFHDSAGIEAIDIAKRLQDYGFHSPTMSWPVANTLMVEPTESESKAELDRFCDAMISIRQEISLIEKGEMPKDNNVLVNAPHPMTMLVSDKWDKPYSREMAAYPLPWLKEKKFWPSVGRLDDSYGDRHLFCACS